MYVVCPGKMLVDIHPKILGASCVFYFIVGTGKFLGVRKIFAQISTNLPEKYSKEMTS